MTRLERLKLAYSDVDDEVVWLIELVEEARRGAYRHRLDCESCRTWLAKVEGRDGE